MMLYLFRKIEFRQNIIIIIIFFHENFSTVSPTTNALTSVMSFTLQPFIWYGLDIDNYDDEDGDDDGSGEYLCIQE